MSELLYGRHAVSEALRAGRRRFYRLWVESKQGNEAPPSTGPVGDIVAQAEQAGLPVRTVRGGMFDKMRDEHVNAQGVALEAGDYPYVDVEACLARARQASEPPLLLILDHLQDPQNLGTLIRTAESSAIEIKTLPGFLAQHLDWWFSNYCARLNAKKAQLVVLEDEHSKFTGQLRKAAARTPRCQYQPGANLWEQERKFLLAKHVAALDPLLQKVLRALYLDQLTEAETAAKLQYSQSQISRLKQRALAQLRERLLQEGLPREDWLQF